MVVAKATAQSPSLLAEASRAVAFAETGCSPGCRSLPSILASLLTGSSILTPGAAVAPKEAGSAPPPLARSSEWLLFTISYLTKVLRGGESSSQPRLQEPLQICRRWGSLQMPRV